MTSEDVIDFIRKGIGFFATQKGDFSVAYNYGACRGQISLAFTLGIIDLETFKLLADEAEEVFKKLVDSEAVSY